MSRIGKTPIEIPQGVTVALDDHLVKVKGPKGELDQKTSSRITVKINSDSVTVSRKNDSKKSRELHGLTRSLIANMIMGVTEGYQKKLELVGTGYRVTKNGQDLSLTLGFSQPVEVSAPQGISFEIEGNNKITVLGLDKQKVGQTAAEIRALKKPEPYKGKGVRYEGEVVRRKAGKAAKVGAAGE